MGTTNTDVTFIGNRPECKSNYRQSIRRSHRAMLMMMWSLVMILAMAQLPNGKSNAEFSLTTIQYLN